MQMSDPLPYGNRNCVPVLGLGSGRHELESGKKYYFTHHTVPAAGARHALEDIGDDGVSVQIELGLG